MGGLHSFEVTTGVPIYLVSACTSGEEFVAAFRRYADRNGLFIPIAEPIEIGRRGRFALTLTNGGVMVEGEGEVISSARTPSVLHGRVGMTIRFVDLDEQSKTVLIELEKARLSMKPPPPSVPPRPAELPPQPRAVPPTPSGRIDANNALAECVVIGDIDQLAVPDPKAPPKAGPRFVVPTIPPVAGQRPRSPSTPPMGMPAERPRPPSTPPRIPSAPSTPPMGLKLPSSLPDVSMTARTQPMAPMREVPVPQAEIEPGSAGALSTTMMAVKPITDDEVPARGLATAGAGSLAPGAFSETMPAVSIADIGIDSPLFSTHDTKRDVSLYGKQDTLPPELASKLTRSSEPDEATAPFEALPVHGPATALMTAPPAFDTAPPPLSAFDPPPTSLESPVFDPTPPSMSAAPLPLTTPTQMSAVPVPAMTPTSMSAVPPPATTPTSMSAVPPPRPTPRAVITPPTPRATAQMPTVATTSPQRGDPTMPLPVRATPPLGLSSGASPVDLIAQTRTPARAMPTVTPVVEDALVRGVVGSRSTPHPETDLELGHVGPSSPLVDELPAAAEITLGAPGAPVIVREAIVVEDVALGRPGPSVAPPVTAGVPAPPVVAAARVPAPAIEIDEPTDLNELPVEQVDEPHRRKTELGIAVGAPGPKLPTVEELTPSGDWTMTPGASGPTIAPRVAEARPQPMKREPQPTGDWTISLDSDAPDGWSEPSKVDKIVPPLSGPPHATVSSKTPIAAAPPPKSDPMVAEPKVQVDPTLIEPLTPLPIEELEADHGLPVAPQAMSSSRLPSAGPISRPMAAAPMFPPPGAMFTPAPGSIASPSIGYGAQMAAMGLTPQRLVTDGGTGFFRESGDIPHLTGDSTSVLEVPRRRKRILVIIASAALAAVIGIVLLVVLAKKPDDAGTGSNPVGSNPPKVDPPVGSGGAVALAVDAAVEVAPPADAAVEVVQAPVVECSVDVTSAPAGAEILRDKTELLGTTPAKLALPCDVEVKLTLRKARYASSTRQVVPKQRGTKVRVALAKHTFSVKVSSLPPGATVMVNGKSLGVTPTNVKLPAFEMSTLILTKDGYLPETQKITPKQNHMAVQAQLKKKPPAIKRVR